MLGSKDARFLIHAPNIHTGGGLALLHSLLELQPFPFNWVQLDKRIEDKVKLPPEIPKYFVKGKLISRLYAEWRLMRACRAGDIVLCFNGLPPLLPILGKAVVLLQNCLLFDYSKTAGFPLRHKIRLFIEQRWFLYLQKHASHFVVQSNTMAQLVGKQLHPKIPLSIFPFGTNSSENPLYTLRKVNSDFIYIASGDPHKNHLRLLEAWVLLANENIKPSLTLTVDPKIYPELAQRIMLYRDSFGLNINNLGYIAHEEVLLLYRDAKALIYPSIAESLGLPLIEAVQYALPILAAEKDYVRDAAHPVETFDPYSSISIARAVKRFLKIEQPIKIHSVNEFLVEIQQ